MFTTVEIRKNGQVTIPDPVRKALELKEGHIIQLDITVMKHIEKTALK